MNDAPTVPVDQVAPDAVLLDVREQDEWDAGHAPGAIHIPLGDLPTRLEEISALGEDQLVVTCRGGGRASRAVAWLTQQGFDVVNLEGGMKAWAGAGYPVTGATDPGQII